MRVGHRVNNLSKIFLSESRRRIVLFLSTGPKYQSQITSELRIGQQAVVRHLAQLEEAGIVSSWVQKSSSGIPRRYYALTQEYQFLGWGNLDEEVLTMLSTCNPDDKESLRSQLRRLRQLENLLENLLQERPEGRASMPPEPRLDRHRS